MNLITLNPRQALNKAFLKVKPNRSEIEVFKTNLIELLDQINEKETEEFHKNIISKFLDKTYYSGNHYINTKGRNDLVIHVEKDAKSPVAVILETKKPTNKGEMVHKDNLNTKAFQELVLYYMRERISGNNLGVRHLIVTDIYEWYIFDVDIFEKAFAQNKEFEKKFIDFEEKRLAGKNTDFFYKEIAEPAVADLLSGKTKVTKEFSYAYFDIREYEKIVRNTDKKDDNKLIVLYKLLSPAHLLKLPFQNDSNTLDKTFYTELLHIIGLTENNSGGKKVIERKKAGERDEGSIIENTIIQLESLDKLSRLERPSQYGVTNEERYFNIALELAITWINRVLFLKLLEAQLVTYHKNDAHYKFLNKEKIKGYDDLNRLFFQVLAKENKDRTPAVKAAFSYVPYLNSSLFEPFELEQICFPVSQLEDSKMLPLLANTILKDNKGKRKTGSQSLLEYLFSFLDAYDFSSEGSEEIQEENKTLINASVLGLIFEKINGYKDGSFFTPGFITMFICRETIRTTIIQRFNEVKGWKCQTFNELYNVIHDKKEANDIINNLKIIDPAVGSGHFLVSALNEIISLKSDLKILLDKTGKTLRDYHIEVSNDELSVFDEDGLLFEYNPTNKESQRIQETLFHEKETIIENCLFGVDINPNSVKICRLRLWIELLKSAYYKAESNCFELETLPNIDINIKTGNSLISRFPLDIDLSDALKKSKISIKKYKEAVQRYRHAETKEEKRDMENLISTIKGDFRTEISSNDPKVKKFRSKKGELDKIVSQHSLFPLSKTEEKARKKQIEELEEYVQALENEIEEIKANKIFENAFEWRFEFPEVLTDDGKYDGFDIVVGNPPYLPLESFTEKERQFFKIKYPQFERKYETSVMFIVEGFGLLKKRGKLSYIAPATWQTGENYPKFRKQILSEWGIDTIINLPFNTFEDAYVDTSIYLLKKDVLPQYRIFNFDKKAKINHLDAIPFETINISSILEPDHKLVLDKTVGSLMAKYSSEKFITLGAITKSTQGLAGSSFPKAPSSSASSDLYPFLRDGNVYNFCLIKNEVYNTDLNGKQSLKQFYNAEPKILIRRIINRQDRLTVGYTEEQLVFKKDINPFIITDDRFETKFILGVMASQYISYLYLNLSSIAKKDDFRQTTLAELRKLPIPLISKEDQANIISNVDKILAEKSLNPNADTSALENNIEEQIREFYK